ncbi:MAG TPA: hypothetical protein VGG02_02280 [Chthoniobacterales bacterium]|jgi:hypothetical protein
MKNDEALERLLRAASAAPNEPPPAMPFGFDTRVVALTREMSWPDPAIARLLRRVVYISLALIALAGAGAYREAHQSNDREIFGDDYAIADNAIVGAVEQ